MAKKLYHIPLGQAVEFIQNHKTQLNGYSKDKKSLEYHKLLGKAYYYLQIEEFIEFFKIDRDRAYALSTMEYFNSSIFLDHLHTHLNFAQFDLPSMNPKDLFYAFCYLLSHREPKLFGSLMQKFFLHYHTTFNLHSNISIDYQELSRAIVQRNHQEITDSFGEDETGAFFKIFIDGELMINERGKSIKTLRKKAYKRVLFELVG